MPRSGITIIQGFIQVLKVHYSFSARSAGGLSEYAIPKAAQDEVLIEKTPDYTLGSREELLQRAKAQFYLLHQQQI